MSKAQKIWMLVAVCFVIIGALLFVGVMAALDFDFTKLSTEKCETNTYEISETFENISIDVTTAEIEFAASADESCKVVCEEREKQKHSVTVEDRTLVIDTADTRKWYDVIGVSFENMKITVYLPQDAYSVLRIDTSTGDIDIPKNFSFEKIEITGSTATVNCDASASNVLTVQTDTGDITANALCATEMRLSTTTGEIHINSVTSNGTVAVETDTGKVRLTDVTCTDFSAESDTGDITLERVIAAGDMRIESGTGDVRFENSDAAKISVETGTGGVFGTLQSEKVFLTETATGRVRVPKTATGGKCEIKTGTGDIDISVQ